VDWIVKNAVNRDVERQHLNKILQDIRATVTEAQKQLAALRSANGQQDIQSIVGEMVSNNTERGLAVSYNPQRKTLDFIAKDFSISLAGAVTGVATVTSLSNVVIDTELGTTAGAPIDGNVYWQENGEWTAVLPPVSDLQYLDGAGILVRIVTGEGSSYAVREIIGTADEIDVAFGDGTGDNPMLSLADLADTGGGTFKLIARDAKGRLEGTSDGTTDDVPEGTVNLYFPEAPEDGKSYARKDGAWEEVSASGGILPVVTGEIVSGQPVFVYADDGSLLYTEIV